MQKIRIKKLRLGLVQKLNKSEIMILSSVVCATVVLLIYFNFMHMEEMKAAQRKTPSEIQK